MVHETPTHITHSNPNIMSETEVDHSLFSLFLGSALNKALQSTKRIINDSKTIIQLDEFMSDIKELVDGYFNSFGITGCTNILLEKKNVLKLLQERKFNDFLSIAEDNLTVDVSKFDSGVTKIILDSSMDYSKFLVKNINDLEKLRKHVIRDKAEYERELKEKELNKATSSASDAQIDESDNIKVDSDTNERSKVDEDESSTKAEVDNIEKPDSAEDASMVEDAEADESKAVESESNKDAKVDDEEAEESNSSNTADEEESAKTDEVLEIVEEKKSPEVDAEEESSSAEEDESEEDEAQSEDNKEATDKPIEVMEVEEKTHAVDEDGKDEVKEALEPTSDPSNDSNEGTSEEEDDDDDEDESQAEGEDNDEAAEDNKKEQEEEDDEEEEEEKDQKIKTRKRSAAAIADDTKSRKRSSSPSSSVQQHKRFQHIAVNLINSIQAHRFSSPFLQPVNAKDAPDYTQLIHEPKDLKNILKSIKSKSDPPEYQTIEQLERDIMLMFANCIMYNKSDTDLVELTKSMKNDVNNIFKLFKEA